ncbi:LLM class flavin-dependent oxidoreductase [Actinopolymorpha sp. B9G3]|uniref:LLM class flavin-dependent oxidoreductase n=1 Tax=Actinopolymorpha sp. B9G3 TaxID=3158970 RepID=UPI0032D90CDF
MRYGIYVPSFGAYGDPAVLRDLAVAAESAGWHGYFMWDLISPGQYDPPVADPWVVLAAIAQATRTIQLGPMVVPLPRRRPAKLALEAGTLQSLSGGRLILGLGTGVGWDYTNHGESAKRSELAARLDEGATLIHALLSGEPVEHIGTYYKATGVRFPPTDVPVWTSGFWPRKAPVRGARNANGLFPQMRDKTDDFRLPTPSEVRGIRAEFIRAGGHADGDIAIWSPNNAGAPAAAPAKEYEQAGVTWWFQDGSELSPDDLLKRIANGPPAG